MPDLSSLLCVRCQAPAVYAEQLHLDWNHKDGRVDSYLVGACEACRETVRDQIVSYFNVSGAQSANPFVGGCVFQAVFAGTSSAPRRVILWSDVKRFRSWNKSNTIRRRAIEPGPFRDTLGNPSYFVNALDWRGWSPGSDTRKYALTSAQDVERAIPVVASFIRAWVHSLPADWTPTFQFGLPPRSDSTAAHRPS